jgi:hypothetical protein
MYQDVFGDTAKTALGNGRLKRDSGRNDPGLFALGACWCGPRRNALAVVTPDRRSHGRWASSMIFD